MARCCLQVGCGFAAGAFLATTFTQRLLVDAANTSREAHEYTALQGDTAALRLLERGEVERAKSILQSQLFLQLKCIMTKYTAADFRRDHSDWQGAVNAPMTVLNEVFLYTDEVRFFEKTAYRSNYPSIKPVYDFLQAKRGK